MGFKILSAIIDINDQLSEAVREGLQRVAAERVCGIVVYGTSEVLEYHALLTTIKSTVYDSLSATVPVTLVPQYLLPNGALKMDIYTLEGSDKITTGTIGGVCYGLLENKYESLLFIEGIAATNFADSVESQSREVFGRLDSLLAVHNFRVDDIVRQWNYIGKIVGSRAGKQNYQEFNDARTAYYSSGGWQNGYPAATGIGASGEGIIVSAIAFKRADNSGVYPIDNPLQVAAHAYSKDVLIDSRADAVKSTPKFERAKVITTSRGACCFVSGTAAIRGEQSVEGCSAAEQTRLTIENIANLVSKENLERFNCPPYELEYQQLQVFIKRAEDFDDVRAVVECNYASVPTVYTIADVCRSELLVEIEGILTSQ